MDTLQSKYPLLILGGRQLTCDSTGTYKSNTVTITHGINSTSIGLDASSTAKITSANFKAYNVNFANTYGAGVQVCFLLLQAISCSRERLTD